jgi:hypothetical protein
MVTEQPEVVGLGDGGVGRRGDVIGIGLARLGIEIYELRQFVGGEANQVEVVLQAFQVEKFLDEAVFIPGGQLSGFVIGY